MSEKGLRIAAIGAGSHARTTIYPALTAAGYRIEAVATRTRETALAGAAAAGASSAFDDIDAMIADMRGKVDAAVLVLPPDDYAEPLAKCIAAGLPVYCEKPIALDAATLARLEGHRAEAGVPVMAGYMKRFASGYRRARALMGESSFGQPTAYHAYWGMGPGYTSLDYLLRENASHHLDLARFLMGEVIDISAMSLAPQDGSLTVAVLLRFASGAVGTLQINGNSSWDHVNEWISVTGHGSVVLVDNVDTCTLRRSGEPEQRWQPNYTVPSPANSSLAVTGFSGALEHFADVVRTGSPCESDLRSAMQTMELVERVLAVAVPHRGDLAA